MIDVDIMFISYMKNVLLERSCVISVRKLDILLMCVEVRKVMLIY